MSDFRALAEKTVVELFDMVKEKVAEIEQLKTQLNSMEACYIQIKKINDEQSEIIQGHFAARNELQKRVDEALSLFEYPTESWEEVVNRTVSVLRGEHV